MSDFATTLDYPHGELVLRRKAATSLQRFRPALSGNNVDVRACAAVGGDRAVWRREVGGANVSALTLAANARRSTMEG